MCLAPLRSTATMVKWGSMPAVIRSLARVFAGVVVLGTFLVLADATASNATGTTPTVTNVSPNTAFGVGYVALVF